MVTFWVQWLLLCNFSYKMMYLVIFPCLFKAPCKIIFQTKNLLNFSLYDNQEEFNNLGWALDKKVAFGSRWSKSTVPTRWERWIKLMRRKRWTMRLRWMRWMRWRRCSQLVCGMRQGEDFSTRSCILNINAMAIGNFFEFSIENNWTGGWFDAWLCCWPLAVLIGQSVLEKISLYKWNCRWRNGWKRIQEAMISIGSNRPTRLLGDFRSQD